jgi:hypothetical protein
LGRQILVACESAAKAEGFRTLVLRATLAGKPLYTSFGFEVTEHIEVKMPDGTTIACATMHKPIP